MSASLLLWECICLALLWSVFYRLVFVDKTTLAEVRAVLRVAGVAACAGIAAPLYGWRPDWVTLALFATVVAMEIVLSRNWRHGIPVQFIKQIHRLKRRSGDLSP